MRPSTLVPRLSLFSLTTVFALATMLCASMNAAAQAGQLDSSFAKGGIFATANNLTTANAIAIQSDGKIVIAGAEIVNNPRMGPRSSPSPAPAWVAVVPRLPWKSLKMTTCLDRNSSSDSESMACYSKPSSRSGIPLTAAIASMLGILEPRLGGARALEYEPCGGMLPDALETLDSRLFDSPRPMSSPTLAIRPPHWKPHRMRSNRNWTTNCSC